MIFFVQAEDGIRCRIPSRALRDVYKRQRPHCPWRPRLPESWAAPNILSRQLPPLPAAHPSVPARPRCRHTQPTPPPCPSLESPPTAETPLPLIPASSLSTTFFQALPCPCPLRRSPQPPCAQESILTRLPSSTRQRV